MAPRALAARSSRLEALEAVREAVREGLERTQILFFLLVYDIFSTSIRILVY